MKKTLFLQILGYASAPFEIEITPDMSARDILTKAGLEDCSLINNSPPHNYFDPMDHLYDRVTSGECLNAQLPDEIDTDLIERAPVTIDSDEALEELMSLLQIDDGPPSEPIDTAEDDAYIRSWFKEG
jgi:hypothetical protein